MKISNQTGWACIIVSIMLLVDLASGLKPTEFCRKPVDYACKSWHSYECSRLYCSTSKTLCSQLIFLDKMEILIEKLNGVRYEQEKNEWIQAVIFWLHWSSHIVFERSKFLIKDSNKAAFIKQKINFIYLFDTILKWDVYGILFALKFRNLHRDRKALIRYDVFRIKNIYAMIFSSWFRDAVTYSIHSITTALQIQKFRCNLFLNIF